MSTANLKLFQVSNKTADGEAIDTIRSGIVNNIQSKVFEKYSTGYEINRNYSTDPDSTTEYSELTNAVIGDTYKYPPIFCNGKNIKNNTERGLHFTEESPFTLFTSSVDAEKILHPNTSGNLSITSLSQEFDLGFVINRFDTYKKLDDINDIIVLNHEKTVVTAVVVRVGFTFLSNLKLMSKDVYFDILFRNNPTLFEDYLLNSVRLYTDNTIYDGTAMDMDVLNLSKLNISVVNTKDWYVSYNVSSTITDTEINFIRDRCVLKYEFVDKYNSQIKNEVFKKLLIGR